MASKYVIELEDTKGKSFKIEISIPIMPKIGPHRGTWRSLEQGFLRFDNGGTHFVRGVLGYTPLQSVPVDLRDMDKEADLLFFPHGNDSKFGLALERVHNWVGVNDMGVGKVPQDWVLAFEPGWLKWTVVKVL
jgi:hypothetical protein